MDLTDGQWDVFAPLVPAPRLRRDGRGRLWRDPRDERHADNFLGFIEWGCILIFLRHL